jgi:hypothetical protein
MAAPVKVLELLGHRGEEDHLAMQWRELSSQAAGSLQLGEVVP